MAEASRVVLLTAGIIGKGSQIQIELKNTVEALPGLWPCDTAFWSVPSLKRTTTPPIHFTQIGWDFTITSP